MNIDFQLCGFIVCVLLTLFYISKKNLDLYSEKIFFNTMISTSVLLVLDMLSIILINYRDVLPRLLVELVCKAYIVSLLVEGYMALLYILIDVLEEPDHRKAAWIMGFINVIEASIVCCLPILVYQKGRVVYSYGLSVSVAYVFIAAKFLLMFAIVIYFHKIIYPRRLSAFMLWIGIWIVACVIQFLNSQFLLAGFAAALGMVILFVFLENPESNFNRQLGCFNTYAMERYLKQLFERKEEFYLLSVFPEHISEERELEMLRYIDVLKMYKHAYVFKNVNMQFLMITSDLEEIEHVIDIIHEGQKNQESIIYDTNVIYIKNSLMLDNSKNLLGFIEYTNVKLTNNTRQRYLEVTEDMIQDYLEQNWIKDEIKQALVEDRVEVFFQPIYSVHKSRFTSAEALVRIRKSDGSLLRPDLFIPIAEASGLIIELGECIFEKTCKVLRDSNARELGIEYIEVNLSVVQCEQSNLSDRLIEIMEEYDIDPAWINLEITETATLNVKKNLLVNMEKLIEYGTTFSLDDFGKGESNLMYIVEMPITIVKLDFDMTKAYFNIARAKHVVDAVTGMAHKMGLKIVTEGIETSEEMHRMKDQGVDYMQGYYFSKPVPVEEFLEVLRQRA